MAVSEQVPAVETFGAVPLRSTPGEARSRVCILGVPVDRIDREQAVSLIGSCIESGAGASVYFANAHTLNLAAADERYADVLRAADAVLNDGMGLALAAALQGLRFPANLVGTDFVPYLLRCRSEMGHATRVFLFGALPGRAEAAGQRLRTLGERVEIVGTRHGFVPDEARIVRAIRDAAPDLLLVAMGNPLQEQWIHRNREGLGPTVAMGVGALFDFLSGAVPRAPRAFRAIGMEWLFRFAIEPRRLLHRYGVGIPLFLGRAGLEAVRLRLAAHRSRKDGRPPER
jgi:exopolysaccharide biosynthesis WecB/TagA/CpsF family protein